MLPIAAHGVRVEPIRTDKRLYLVHVDRAVQGALRLRQALEACGYTVRVQHPGRTITTLLVWDASILTIASATARVGGCFVSRYQERA